MSSSTKYFCISVLEIANLRRETSRSATNGRRMTKPPKNKAIIPVQEVVSRPEKTLVFHAQPRALAGSTGTVLSHTPHTHPSASNVFGIGSEHPFANYWTCQGGLAEVISVLPERLQADMLLERYFDCVDAVYPMIHRQTFFADYTHFWNLPSSEKADVDGAMIGLIFAMLAMGTQFVQSGNTKQTAEFYVSASHQALRLSSYLNKTSIRSIQAMVLITYFLINDNHASDGWAFAGILIRQAYAMGLHRDPNIVCPEASIFEKQQRRKLWQAVLLQDTFLTVLLSLPPSATHTDVNVSDLIDDTSSIASSSPTDTAYIRGCWHLANLVQEVICSPRSLDLPICSTSRQKTKLVSDFKSVYRSLPDIFRSWNAASLTQLAETNKRVVRQTLFLTSNYWHNVMLLHTSESAEVPTNVRGALEAAHEAITSFFLLHAIFGGEARVWWVFGHRAFLEALCMGTLLRDFGTKTENGESESARESREALFVRASVDIGKCLLLIGEIAP